MIEITSPEEKEYDDGGLSTDGGLVCFVPRSRRELAALPILVCNPLTNERKFLPFSAGSGSSLWCNW